MDCIAKSHLETITLSAQHPRPENAQCQNLQNCWHKSHLETIKLSAQHQTPESTRNCQISESTELLTQIEAATGWKMPVLRDIIKDPNIHNFRICRTVDTNRCGQTSRRPQRCLFWDTGNARIQKTVWPNRTWRQ